MKKERCSQKPKVSITWSKKGRKSKDELMEWDELDGRRSRRKNEGGRSSREEGLGRCGCVEIHTEKGW